MPPLQGTAKLEDKTILNERYAHYFFELVEPNILPFQAGQYLSIQVSEEGHRRSYSICSSPDIQHGFEMMIDFAPDGLGSNYLKGMQFGDEMKFLGPMGLFTVEEKEPEPELVFIATGSGIAPYRSMLFDLLQLKHDQRKITLLWGMRYVEQLFWQDEFQELAQSFSNFSFHPVVSQALPEWQLCRGRVGDCLAGHEFNWDAGFYLCGNTDMITATRDQLLGKNVHPSRIHSEKFY